MKKRFCIILSLATASSILLSGCGKNVTTITDYPDENKFASTTVIEGKDPAIEAEKDISFIDEKVEYDPCAINNLLANDTSEEVVAAAKALLQAIDNCEDHVDLESIGVNENVAMVGFNLAYMSNPIAMEVIIEESDGTTVPITYVDGVDVFREKRAAYVEEINAALETYATPGKTKIECARDLYTYVIENMEPDYTLDFNDNLDESEHVDEIESYGTVDAILNHKGGVEHRITYYTMLMEQIGVDCLPYSATGHMIYEGSETLSQLYPTTNYSDYTVWLIISLSEGSYHCDPVFDTILYYEEKELNADASFTPQFFGMSDETRKKSWEFDGYYFGSVYSINAAKSQQRGIPECESDY